MKKKCAYFLVLVFFFISSGLCADHTTTSVIIPCHSKHFHYLYDLLKIYELQTVLPDEIVISLSESHEVDHCLIAALKNEQWKFPVKLLCSKEKLFAGQNRNIACENAIGEIIICQDADDLPHRQRIEIIKYFFSKFNLDFLLHKFVYNSPEQVETIKELEDFGSIAYTYVHTYHDAWIVGYMLFGQPAFHRRVFQKIKWRDIPIDEDNTFDNEVFQTFEQCMMIFCPLYIYRMELSITPYWLYRGQ